VPEREESRFGQIREVRRKPDQPLADSEPGAGRSGEDPESVSDAHGEPPRRGERYAPAGDARAEREAAERAIASEVEVKQAEPEQHGIQRVSEYDESEQYRGRKHPSPIAVAEQPIASVEPTDREKEGERADRAARRQVPGEHRRTGRDDERREAGFGVRA